MSVPPAFSRLDPLRRLPRLRPCSGLVHIPVADPGIHCHLSIRIQIIPGSTDLLPADFHGSVIGASKVIPGIVVFQPARMHRSGWIQIVPACVRSLPSCLHHTGSIQIIPASIHFLPAGFHGSIIGTSKIVPVFFLLQPSGLHIAVLVKIIPVLPDTFPCADRITSVILLPPPAGFVLFPGSRLYIGWNQ